MQGLGQSARMRCGWVARSALQGRAWLALGALLLGCSGARAPERKSKTDAGSAADAAPRDAAVSDAGPDAAVELDAGVEAVDAAADAGAQRLPPPVAGEDSLSFDPALPAADGTLSLDFDLPVDAVSFVLTADPGGTPREIVLLQVTAPDGTVLFDASVQGPQPFDPGVSSSVNDALPYSVMLPSSPETPFASGRYRVQLGVANAPAGAPRQLAIDVVWKRAAEPPSSGQIALALWFVQGAMLDATTAHSDPYLQPALGVMHDIYAGMGVELGPIEYHELDGAQAASLVAVQDADQLAELLSLVGARAAPGSGLPLVFVDDLQSAPGTTVRGKASGLPGPPPLSGARRLGGVVIALSTLPVTSRGIGELLAHETAHYLGLRHTSEYDGVRHDPIADTPECPADRATHTAADGTALLSAEDCSDLDGTNLMFYTPPVLGTSQQIVTPGQAFVLLRNPLVR